MVASAVRFHLDDRTIVCADSEIAGGSLTRCSGRMLMPGKLEPKYPDVVVPIIETDGNAYQPEVEVPGVQMAG